MKLNKLIVTFIYTFIALGVVACSGVNFTDWRFPYMYPVQQGNYITDEQITQLKVGMTKEQVSFVIGHPVSQFMFSSTQWQYVYQMHNNNKLKNSYIVNINFDTAEKLTSVESAGEAFVK
jgi:outer membrane protein assembly factor BamE (lipoprotein component of BamABCDE complex)